MNSGQSMIDAYQIPRITEHRKRVRSVVDVVGNICTLTMDDKVTHTFELMDEDVRLWNSLSNRAEMVQFAKKMYNEYVDYVYADSATVVGRWQFTYRGIVITLTSTVGSIMYHWTYKGHAHTSRYKNSLDFMLFKDEQRYVIDHFKRVMRHMYPAEFGAWS